MSKIERGSVGNDNDDDDEPMTEWNLYLCPNENISQGHFILIVCRAKVTPKVN